MLACSICSGDTRTLPFARVRVRVHVCMQGRACRGLDPAPPWPGDLVIDHVVPEALVPDRVVPEALVQGWMYPCGSAPWWTGCATSERA